MTTTRRLDAIFIVLLVATAITFAIGGLGWAPAHTWVVASVAEEALVAAPGTAPGTAVGRGAATAAAVLLLPHSSQSPEGASSCTPQ